MIFESTSGSSGSILCPTVLVGDDEENLAVNVTSSPRALLEARKIDASRRPSLIAFYALTGVLVGSPALQQLQ